MVTMAFAQDGVLYLFFDNKVLGGSDGIYVNFKPSAALFDPEDQRVSITSPLLHGRGLRLPAASAVQLLAHPVWHPGQ